MLGCLRALDEALRERGSGLVVRHGRPEDELVALAAEAGARGGAVDERRRAVRPRARPRASPRRSRRRRARAAAGRLVRRRRLEAAHAGRQAVHRLQPVSPPLAGTLERRTVHRAPAELPPLPSGVRKGRLPALDALGLGDGATLAEPFREPGEPAARAALARWLDGADRRLRARRTTCSRGGGTSGLSPYLRWGCLSAAECEARAARRGGAGAERVDPPARAGASSTRTSC